MAIRVALHHQTEYIYDRPVTVEPHVVRLRPAPHCRTPILSYSLTVKPGEPGDHFLNWQQDPYSNYLARLVFNKPARELSFTVDLVAEMVSINPFDFFIEQYAEKQPFIYDPVLARELLPYLETPPPGPALAALVAETRQANVRTIDYLVSLNHHLNKLIRYVIRLEPGIQTCEETLSLGSGSCRDSAWLLGATAAASRAGGPVCLGLSDSTDGRCEIARWPFRTGKRLHRPARLGRGLRARRGLDRPRPDERPARRRRAHSARLRGRSDHRRPDHRHLHVEQAVGRRPGREQFRHEMVVSRIHEDPRVTKPYTDRQWKQIDSLGREIDELLRAGDVRLTMGGEPTFVSIDKRDADEWNTAALGEHKRERAGLLLRSLRDRFAPVGLLHFGQGKWYPGESLPRWALGCYWRKDGVPIWNDPALVAEDGRDYHVGPEEARRFAEA